MTNYEVARIMWATIGRYLCRGW